MSEELKPCPICEGQYLNVCAHGGTGKREWHIECDHCGCACPTESETEAEAYAAWNALPRRLKWTREKPTKTDFYWHKDGKMLRIGEIMELSGSLFCHFAGENEPQLLDLIDGEWAGPIPEPMEAE